MVPNLLQQVASSLSFVTTRQFTKYPPKTLRSQHDVSWRLGASAVVNHDGDDNDNPASCSGRSTLTPLSPTVPPNVMTSSSSSSSSLSLVQNACSSAIAPTAVLVGGTALLYQSVLQHPSCSLTPLAVLYMVLLAIQTSLQPRLSRRYIHPKTNKAQVALVEEVVKTSLAAVILVSQGNLSQILKDWTLQSSLVVAGIPATLYALQGVLTYTSHQHLDAVTFNGLSQTKTLTAALCCYLVLRQPQSPWQMVSLLGLLFSALLFQTTTTTTATNTASNRNATNNHHNSFFVQGVLPCLAATFLSGLAGAFSQRGLQIVGGTGRNAFLYTVEVSACSAVTLLLGLLLNVLQKCQQHGAATTNDNHSLSNDNETKDNNKNANWTWQTYIPITTKAVGGILTALVHKHAGSVVKGFALMLGLVMSGILQSLWVSSTTTSSSTNDASSPRSLSMNQAAGIVIVMLSSWLHFTNPPSR